MGLLGSLIKTVVKAPLAVGALGVDVLTNGVSCVINDDGEFLTQKAFKSLTKEVKKVSKGLDNL